MKKYLVLFLLLLFALSVDAKEEDINNLKLIQIKSSSLVNQGMYSKALKLINKGLKKHPNNDYLIALKGKCYQGKNNIEEAELYFQKALSLNPNNEFALMYAEKTKKTKILLKNDTQEEIYHFMKDKGVDLLFIFLGFLAGEILATILMRCDRYNWKLIVYKIQLKKQQKFYILNPKYLAKIIYKYIFDSVCPLKIILIYLTLLIILILIFVGYEIVMENTVILNIETSKQLWQHILGISVYASMIIFFGWIFKIGLEYKNTYDIKIKIVEILHNMYQKQDIIELHELLQELSKFDEKASFKKIINTYIIDRNEIKYFLKLID
ncbi:tetratricopeptide repeat protein [Sulfurimonas sp.]